MTGRRLGLDDPRLFRQTRRTSGASRKSRAFDRRKARRKQRARDRRELIDIGGESGERADTGKMQITHNPTD